MCKPRRGVSVMVVSSRTLVCSRTAAAAATSSMSRMARCLPAQGPVSTGPVRTAQLAPWGSCSQPSMVAQSVVASSRPRGTRRASGALPPGSQGTMARPLPARRCKMEAGEGRASPPAPPPPLPGWRGSPLSGRIALPPSRLQLCQGGAEAFLHVRGDGRRPPIPPGEKLP
jgi:hypothetical protein